MGDLQILDEHRAILDADGDVAVTASAGTGKTAILVEHFAEALLSMARGCDGSQASPVMRLAGITFTDAAAAEMKNRIRERLRQAYADSGEPKLLELTRELDAAYIGTIHSFCARLLRESFIAAGLSPAFTILDEQEAAELRDKSAGDALKKQLPRDRLLADLASSIGFSTLRSNIAHVAGLLRCAGFNRLDADRMLDDMMAAARGEAAAVYPALSETLSALRGEVAAALADPDRKVTNNDGNILKELSILLEGWEALLPDSSKITGEIARSFLDKLQSVHLTRGTACRGVNEKQKLIKDFWSGKGSSLDLPALESLAGFEGDAGLIRSVLICCDEFLRRYGKAKGDMETLDFDDLLIRARDMLEADEDVLRRYRARFERIYVDEFQDVNPLQRRIVQLLWGRESGRRLFIVGDGKQSIYRFRGADVLGFEEFKRDIVRSGGRELGLQTNWRSGAELIDFYNSLFGSLFSEDRAANEYQVRFDEFKHRPGAAVSEEAQVELLQTDDKDGRVIGAAMARRILALVNEEPPAGRRRLTFGDIAVLFRSTTDLPKYEIELRRRNIPYMVVGGKGLLQQREVWDVASYLRLLWFPEDHYALAAALRSPLCLLSDETLLLLAQHEMLSTEKLLEPGRESIIPESDGERERLLIFIDLLRRQADSLDRGSSAELMEELLEATDYEAFLLTGEGGEQAAANVRAFIELARDFESRGTAGPLEFIQNVWERLFTDAEAPQALLGGEGRHVRLMTIHKSKGLQFPVVFIPQLTHTGKAENSAAVYDYRKGMGVKRIDGRHGLPETSPSWKRVNKAVREQERAESTRLFYVAQTRAREKMILIGPDKPVRGGALTPWCNRLAELETGEGEMSLLRKRSPDDFPATAGGAARPLAETEEVRNLRPLPCPDDGSRRFAESLVSRVFDRPRRAPSVFVLGVHELIALMLEGAAPELDDGRAPSPGDDRDTGEPAGPRASALSAGNAVHAFLERHAYRGAPSQEDATDYFRARGFHEKSEAAAALVVKWLRSPLAREIGGLEFHHEVPFTTRLQGAEGSIYLNGVIDLLARPAAGGLWLLDYKFANFNERHSRHYELQLKFYALAVGRAFGATPARLSLVYLKDDDNQVRDYSTSDEELAALEADAVRAAARP